MDGAQLIGALFGIVVGAAIGALIGAIFLRAGIWLYNKMAGPTGSVAEPTFGRAIVISFVVSIVSMLVGFVLGFTLAMGAAAGNADPQSMSIISNLLGLPIGLLISTVVLSAMLPTSFGRAFLVTLCQVLIGIAVALCLLAIVFLVIAATR